MYSVIIVNMSNIVHGGGLQVAISICEEMTTDDSNQLHIIINETIATRVKPLLATKNIPFTVIQKFRHSPLSLIHYIKTLNAIEKKLKPSAVFTLFGPSLWRPKVPHVTGYAIPHYIYPDSPFFDQTTMREKIRSLFREWFVIRLLKRNSDMFIVETDDVKRRLCKKLKTDPDKIFVVTNTYANVFNVPVTSTVTRIRNADEIIFLTVSMNYPHKNLKVIPLVVSELKKLNPNLKFKFVLTTRSFLNINNFESSHLLEHINFIGPVELNDCPALYSECNFVFLPTLLECFSASYIEAMKMGKPILTSNISSAKAVCGDAAAYFDPLSPKNIAACINDLIQNTERQKELIQNGNRRLPVFESATTRKLKYINIMKGISRNVNNGTS